MTDNFLELAKVLCKIKAQFGEIIFEEPFRVRNILSDFMPGKHQEIELAHKFLELGYLKYAYNIANSSPYERNKLIGKLADKLTNEIWITEIIAENIISSYLICIEEKCGIYTSCFEKQSDTDIVSVSEPIDSLGSIELKNQEIFIQQTHLENVYTTPPIERPIHTVCIASSKNTKVFFELKTAVCHGLISGSTGTGKTRTAKLLAETFSDMGVPVFFTDIKGDASTMCKAGDASEYCQKSIKICSGLTDNELNNDYFYGSPTRLWDISGEKGHQIRVTLTSFGTKKLAYLLNLDDKQNDILECIFSEASSQGLLLIDLKDLKSVIYFLSEDLYWLNKYRANEESTFIELDRILKKVIFLETTGMDEFFGEPMLDVEDILTYDTDGRGFINILQPLGLKFDKKVYTLFLMWLLEELSNLLQNSYNEDKPKIVLFIEEAQYLFCDIQDDLLRQIEYMLQTIQTKGIGIFFVTEYIEEIPKEVLRELGNKIQHCINRFSMLDNKRETIAKGFFWPNPKVKVKSALGAMSNGEALFSMLDTNRRPKMVERAHVMPTHSTSEAYIDQDLQNKIITESPLYDKYRNYFDRISAYEVLRDKNIKGDESTTSNQTEAAVKTSTPSNHNIQDHIIRESFKLTSDINSFEYSDVTHIACPKCGAVCSPEDKFCGSCGYCLMSSEVQFLSCPCCGARCSVNDRFCLDCGYKLISHKVLKKRKKTVEDFKEKKLAKEKATAAVRISEDARKKEESLRKIRIRNAINNIVNDLGDDGSPADYIMIAAEYLKDENKDVDIAVELYKKAAADGEDFGNQCLGMLYFEGKYVPQDYVKAMKFFTISNCKKSACTYYSMAEMYRLGLGVNIDEEKAFYLYQQIINDDSLCAELDDYYPRACFRYAQILRSFGDIESLKHALDLVKYAKDRMQKYDVSVLFQYISEDEVNNELKCLNDDIQKCGENSLLQESSANEVIEEVYEFMEAVDTEDCEEDFDNGYI